ncbi:MAG: HAMP domain-containing histidine kinase [Bacteroidales bacterium]|nr:HAMP domain-containing histidine kinase [Bacteroidales bacterium]
MDMDFKNKISNNTHKALYGIFIAFWIVILALLVALWNKYSNTSINVAKNQLEIYNNYLLSINPNDTSAINNAPKILLKCSNTPITHVFLSIYNSKGTRLYSNASAGRNSSILSFKEIQNLLKSKKDSSYTISQTIHDNILDQKCIVSTTFCDQYDRYIISECTIDDTTTFTGFLSEMSLKITLVILISFVAITCISLMRKHINNIDRLKRFILQLSDENDLANDSTKQNKSGINNITEDLYTLFKKQLDTIRQHDLERDQAIKKQKEKLQSKHTLANNLNHEIKTPIGIIIGYLDTLINHPDIDLNTRQNFLKKCLLNTQRLQNMVVNIAVINRIEDGSSNIALEDINIYEVVNHAKEDLKFTLSEYNMNFKIEIEHDTFVRANEMLLYNVFCNLIKNSCFYSHGTDIVLCELSRNNKFIIFSLYDNGTGVPQDAIDKLFNRFYRLEKDKNKKSGTGLGLPIVQESINLCGGSITAHNRPNGGLEFKFTLPIA